jgi:hypothetical protein
MKRLAKGVRLSRRTFFLQSMTGVISTPQILADCGKATTFALPANRFFVFGEGDRKKFLYKRGTLLDLHLGEIVWHRPVNSERYLASETAIEIETTDGWTRISEDDKGVWIGKERIASGAPISRPTFEPSPYAGRLRALHHEILVNLVNGEPLPNLLAYSRPWRRDAAMVAMCLAKTGNLDLIKPWVLNLQTVFDHNANVEESDNLGQNLYLLGIVDAPRQHPLVEKTLESARRFTNRGAIIGLTDGAEHTVYQTLWMKMGLKTMNLPDPYEVPFKFDHYGSLVWWFPQHQLAFPFNFNATTAANYPYLSWAEAHYWYSSPPPLPTTDTFPQTWEANASEADYGKMEIVGSDWAKARVSGPHSWHAAEAFLYLLELGATTSKTNESP